MDILKIIGIVANLFGRIRDAGADGKIEMSEILAILLSLAESLGVKASYAIPRDDSGKYLMTLSVGDR